LGSIISTTVFIALNSVEFCNKFIFSVAQTDPLLSISTFIWWWAMGQMIVTIYILLFVTEKHGQGEEDEEIEISISQSPAIFIDILKKP
jgi:PAT family acetyl-CoA transporter-like MFS transporter 1